MDEHPFQQQRQILREFRQAVTTRQQQEQEANQRWQTERQDADRTLKHALEQAKRHRDQEEARITQKYQAALRTAEDKRAAKQAQAERLLKETETATRFRYRVERKQADTLLEQTKGEAKKQQEQENAQATQRYYEAVKAAEEAWAQAQKRAADGQAKSQEDLGQCQDYLVKAGLSTALIPDEILPAPPEGMSGDEDPAQMLEQSLEAVEETRRAIRQAVDNLLHWREIWRRRRNWAIGIAVTAAIVVMIGLSIHNAQVQEMARQATATAYHSTYVAMMTTATAQAAEQATAQAAEQATATAQAAERATATAQARATATAQARTTATAQARATATVEAIQATVSALESRKKRVFGPSSGSLEHNANDDLVSWDGADVQLKNFICTVTFFNPYSTSEGTWDYGVLFRDTGGNKQYRLGIQSNGNWELTFVDDPTWDTIASGHIDNLNTSPNGHNRLRLVVKDELAYFYVNDVYISTLDVSRKQVSGNVVVATGIWSGDEITGKSTRYEDFTVWSLP